ncbi:amino acid adenylation domain-containing protein [Micromonospora sp. RP3T]|uniref:non-ribosomal peptide synthetase n=1 Tax=Micromonospora sp. RP3T TaxID=2135446 RepID=UPI003D73E564
MSSELSAVPTTTADRERLRSLLLRRTPRRAEVDDGPAPLSAGQRRLWFLDRLLPDSALYNAPLGFRVRGPLDVDALRAALATVVDRHEALRTTFTERDGRAVQVVHDRVEVPWRSADLTGLPGGHRDDEARRLSVASAREPFDLSAGPLLRLLLLRLAEDDHVVVVTVHHAVVDGWSLAVLFTELGAAYEAHRAGRTTHLARPRTTYRAYARAQDAALAGEAADALAAHWRTVLAGAPQEVTFPADRPRRDEPTYRGGLCGFSVSAETTAGLRALARAHDATLFMVLLAGFAVLLGRFARTREVVVGSPVAGRDHPDLEGLVGFFVNSVVLRTDLSGAPTVAEMIARVRSTALDAYQHQGLPFERLVDELRPERRLSMQPLFQTSFQVFETSAPTRPDLAGCVTEDFPVDTGTAKFDTSWLLTPDGNGLTGQVEFARDSYDEATVSAFTRAYVRVLDQLAADPDRPVADLDLLTAEDRDRLLSTWNDDREHRPPEGRPFVHQAVHARASADPDAVAVRDADGTDLTYAELASAVDGLARALRGAGVGRGDRVGVCLPRSADLVVAFLAVLRAGAAYVPVDPAQPAHRVRQLLTDAGPRLVVSAGAAAGPLTGLDVPVLGPRATLDGPPVDVPLLPDDAAYVIYTSGSTGRPKGVVVTHGGLANYLHWCVGRYLAAPGGSALLTSCAYDLVMPALYAPLLVGQPVVVLDPDLDLTRLGETLAEAAPFSFLKLTPGHLDLLVDQLGAERARALARVLVVGGEDLATDTAAPWLGGDGPELLNEYGPTEATVANCTHLATPADRGASVPIGVPIPHTTQYVLDEQLRPLPPGAVGELHIGGVGVARGYLDQPGLTAAAFPPDPFSGRPGARLYRTGDLVRQRPDGVMEYLGRRDDQVKINGHRVEPREVAAQMREHPAVRDAVVTVRRDRDTPALVAYLVPETGDDGGTTAAAAQQQRTWREVFDTSYSGTGGAADDASDLAGWTSSFTGEPVDEAAMREWVAASVDRIRALRPRRILEIGCGTGLLLRALAPDAERYVGLDFSAEALAHVHERMTRAGERTDHVALRQLAADELDRVEERFDVVVVNSVAQYFPSGDYLRDVLTAAVVLTVDGGAVFVGDVRDLSVAGVEATAVELFRAADDVPADEVLHRVRARLARESELLVDPRFFTRLAAELPRLRDAAAAPRRGRLDSEMTRFRYDVVLRVGADADGDRPDDGPRWTDWTRDGWSLRRLAAVLAADPPALAVADVPNARTADAAQALATLESGAAARAGDLRHPAAAVSPQDVYDLAAAHGVEVELRCSPGSGGRFHLLVGCPGLAPPPAGAPVGALTNDPLRGAVSRRYAELVRPYLTDRLPPAMVPATYVVLDRIPLTANGKLDRAALPAPADSGAGQRSVLAPRTLVEAALAQIWCEVLDLAVVGVHDNFFELGGDSIQGIRVVSRAVAAGHPITPKMIFQYPTVAELAQAVGSIARVDAEQGRVVGPVPPTPITDWFLSHGDPRADLVVQHVTVPLPAGADTATVADAVARLLDRHDALRMRLTPHGLDIPDHNPVTVTTTPAAPDSPHWPDMVAAACAGIDVSTGPLLAAVHGDGAVLLAAHHLAVDAVSWSVLVEDFAHAYRGARPPGAKTVSVRQWAAHLADAVTGGDFDAEIPHWRAVAGAAATSLTGDAGTYGSAAVHRSRLPATETADLIEKVPRAYRTRITEVLLATLARVLRGWAGGDVLIDAEGHGRDATDLDLSRTVGWFTTLYPALVPVDDPGDLRAALLAAKEHLRSSPSRGLAYGVLHRLAGVDGLAATPRVRFNYLGRLGSASAIGAEPFTVTAPGTWVSPTRPRPHLLEVDAAVIDGELLIDWTHHPKAQPTAEVAALAARFVTELRATVAHCLDPANHGRTPSDFPLAGLDQATIDRYFRDRDIEDVYPLTPTQEGMVFESVTATEPGMYLEQVGWRMRDLDEARFVRAWEQTATRHEVLRTGLVTTGERTFQVVRRRATVPVTVVDLTGDTDPGRALAELHERDRARGVDLSGGGPLLRLTLARLGGEHHVLVTNHHVVLDGWSSALVFTEVLRRYGGTWSEPGQPPPYRRYVADVLAQAARPSPADVDYWRTELGDVRPRSLDLGEPDQGATGTGAVDVDLPAGLADRVADLAGRLRLTAGTVVRGAWALLLSRYLASTDVVCGVTVSGRAGLADPEGMVGLFINTVPARVGVPGGARADRWLADLHAASGRRPEVHSVTDIRSWVGLDPTVALFDTVLVVENYPMDAGLRDTLAGPEGAMAVTDRTNYPLTVAVELGRSAAVRLLFDRDRHPEAAVTTLAARLVRTLVTLVEQPHLPLWRIAVDEPADAPGHPAPTAPDRRAGTAARDCVAVVLEHARRAPTHPAVVAGDATVDYATLVSRAAALAGDLAGAGAGPDVPVAVLVPKSVDLVVAQLAVWWAGAAYLPLDPDQPDRLRRQVLTRAGCTLGVGAVDTPTPRDGVTWLPAGRVAAAFPDAPAVPHPEATAYVLHTSGSTGVPKGVAVPRGVLAAHLEVIVDRLGLRPEDRVLHLSPPTFDIAVEQVLGTLVAGATVVLGDPRSWTPREFLTRTAGDGVTVANLAAPYWHQVVEEFDADGGTPDALPLRALLLGADKVHGDAVARWTRRFGDRVALWHGYGVTEAVITSTLGRIDPDRTGTLAGIGEPLPLRSLDVRDVHGNRAPVGVPGEVFLSGPALARGYLAAPAATAAAFVPDPDGGPGARAYRTGDLGRRRPDGTLDLLGRIDDQVKVRGLRVEPGQVEYALRDHPDVTGAAVVVHADRLVAFVTGVADTAAVREHCAQVLPGALVPDVVLAVDAMPLTANGKLDRDALRRRAARAGTTRDESAPVGVIENLVADVWREVLKVDRVARRDDFFRLGGHSLRAMSVATRLREALGVEIPVRSVLRHPTLVDFAAALTAHVCAETGIADLESALSGA